MTANNYKGTERRDGSDRREDGNWYTNKELFERIEQMSDKFNKKVDDIEIKIGSKIENVQNEIRKYNNLNEKISVTNQTTTEMNQAIKNLAADTTQSIEHLNTKLNGQITKCTEINALKKGRQDIGEMIRTWLPVIVTVSLFIFFIADRYGG